MNKEENKMLNAASVFKKLYTDIDLMIHYRELISLYWELTDDEKRELTNNTNINQAQTAMFIYNSLIHAFTLVLMRINDKYDKDNNRTICFRRLAKLLEKENHSMHQEFMKKLKKHNELNELNKLKEARNKFIAHTDETFESLPDSMQPKHSDLIKPYESSLELMRLISPFFLDPDNEDIDSKINKCKFIYSNFKTTTFPFLSGAEFAAFMKSGLKN